ncbi:chemotaxis protein CheW [Marinobacter sp. SS21]|uniref:chemotaxis protein CheW n=1 Tax=Marinobacter sp. SS21 TaxID=2979460 RepID=UPI00232C3B29|nr:chemotaxis protein CheW [Marinobacter sp. SS21]MDC0663414.1 chemotaxis protein CheW [Marinobacter sp. SS21]
MAESEQYLLEFGLGDMRYALELQDVCRVLRAVAISPLPASPSIVKGVVNVAGQLLAVVDLRARLGLPKKSLEIEDRLIWVTAAGYDLLLPVDTVQTVQGYLPDAIAPATDVPEPAPLLKGLVRLPDGVMLIQDLTGLLELPEREALAHAVDRQSNC